MPAQQRGLRAVEHYCSLIAAISVAAATVVFHPGRAHVAKGRWALLYLVVVGLVAGVSGVGPALTAAVLSFFAWNYFFLPPYGTRYVADTRDRLSLLVFPAVGVIIGLQTGRLWNREAELLNRFSAQLVFDISIREMASRLVAEVDSITGSRLHSLVRQQPIRWALDVRLFAGGRLCPTVGGHGPGGMGEPRAEGDQLAARSGIQADQLLTSWCSRRQRSDALAHAGESGPLPDPVHVPRGWHGSATSAARYTRT